MSEATRVSVVMPVLDRERYIRESVESILATGYGNLEIVIVDDGSTDDTSRILTELRSENPGVIRLLEHPGRRNIGCEPSVNRGLAAVIGEYVCFLDSDDLMLPHRFDTAVPLLDGDPELDGVVEVAEVLFEDEEDRRLWGDRPTRYGPRVDDIPPDRFLEAWLIERKCTLHTPNLLVRTRLFGKSGLHRTIGGLSEDHHLRLRMAACGRFAVGGIGRPISRYRRHAGNLWNPDRWDSLRDLGVLRDVLGWARRSPQVPPRNVAVLEEAYRRKARWCLSALRVDRDRGALARLALRLLAADPGWALDRGFLANLGRGLLVRPGAVGPDAGSG